MEGRFLNPTGGIEAHLILYIVVLLILSAFEWLWHFP